MNNASQAAQRLAKGKSETNRSEGLFVVPITQNSFFTGREKVIEDIWAYFSGEARGQRRVVLTGLGGIGKTQIATAFAYKAFDANMFSAVFQVFADTRETLLRSFADIAEKLGLSKAISPASQANPRSTSVATWEDTTSAQVRAVLSWLTSGACNSWLLIVDNADDLESFSLSEFFPNVPYGHIIITSRRQAAGRLGRKMEIDTMKQDKAVELLCLCSQTDMDVDLEEAHLLVKVLGHLPLAIDQAGAFIAEHCITFEDYFRLFVQSEAQVLKNKPPKAIWSYEHTVYTTWEMSYQKVESMSSLAAMLLDVAGCLSSIDLPLELILDLVNADTSSSRVFLSNFIPSIREREDYSSMIGTLPSCFSASNEQITTSIGKLLSLSLIKRKPSSRSLRMHPLVHSWIKDRLPEVADRVKLVQTTLGLVLLAIFNACDLSRFTEVQELYPHVFICTGQLGILPQLWETVDAPRIAASLIAVDAWVPLSADRGTLQKSDRFFEMVEASQRPGAWTIPKALLMKREANRAVSMGLHKQCAAICEEFFASHVVKDRYDQMYLCCMAQNYAPSLFRELKHDKAQEIYSKADTSCDASGYMKARKDLVLGAIWLDQGRFKEAETTLMSSIKSLDSFVGRKFYIWAVCHQLLALCYLAQRRAEEAELIVAPVVTQRLDDHETGIHVFDFSDYEMAEIYSRSLRMQGKFEECLNLLDRLLSTTYSKFPPPARALGELSFVTAQLDAKISRGLEAGESELELITSAYRAFERAQLAYSAEWNRGTWVFKFCQDTIKDLERKLKQGFTYATPHRSTMTRQVGTSHLIEGAMALSRDIATDAVDQIVAMSVPAIISPDVIPGHQPSPIQSGDMLALRQTISTSDDADPNSDDVVHRSPIPNKTHSQQSAQEAPKTQSQGKTHLSLTTRIRTMFSKKKNADQGSIPGYIAER